MTGSQFDELGQVYEESSGMAFRQGLEFPTVLGHLGDIGSQDILDFGCGSGVYTRLLARRGARRTVGLDASEGMVEHCRRREEDEPLGVEYVAGELPERLHGAFDTVLGVYVLPHAETYDGLVAMCRTAAAALRPGGRFLTLPIHPDVHPDPEHYARYGFRLDVSAREDGAPVDFGFTVGEHSARFTARYWTAASLEGALRDAGFGAPRWRAHQVSGAAEPGPSDDFWARYLTTPHAAVLDARKA
ncbi:class I SAM-dependent methyltransferase [Streptomyces sp. MNP-20]|uniref:class I SAM-dependent methyltransferase n=1 Tax=Streptomyces sp. MNP-20 TaxID=2721165 RepID=UPI0015535C36|nr:class I SAM-dependent methyltransferase [Streptomyces sp. MNP-20]